MTAEQLQAAGCFAFRDEGEGAQVRQALADRHFLRAVIKGRQYYRDTRGYCYYVDQYGNPIYDYNVRC